MIRFSMPLFTFILIFGSVYSIDSPMLAQTFLNRGTNITITVNEVKGNGRYREAWLTWTGGSQQVSLIKRYDCNTKTYSVLSSNGVLTSPTIRSVWVDDMGSGEVRYVCSR